MDLARIRRITIALTAAYALALHALLLSFVPLSAAALTDSLAALCAYNDTDRTGYPAQHEIPCVAVCAAMGHGTGHGMAGAVPAAVAEIFTLELVAAVIISLVERVAPNMAPIGPQTSRGPPAI
jgi:hypothetical protein